jgi:hypothetical protein
MCNVWNDDKEDAFLPEGFKEEFKDPFYESQTSWHFWGGEPTLNPKLLKILVILTG